ncbi:MAG: hypothetical protein M5U23_03785 [Acidimicrobiia bacterium]|nr:hypothetical protein [Acidimicrobiia bacterium]
MAVQTGEGVVDIIFHSTSIPAGPRTLGGYLSRPDGEGQWPTVLIFGPEPTPTSTVKDICRVLARHGLAALAPDLTESREQNLSISLAVAAYIADPSGRWSNGQVGYGVLSFGAGVHDLADLAQTDTRVAASVVVSSTIDAQTAKVIGAAEVPGLVILSRGDETVDVDASIDTRADMEHTTFVVYPSGATGFWDASTEGYDVERYEDTVDRIVAFFSEHLPERF